VPAFLGDGIYIPMLAGPAFGPMLDANMRTEFAGTPTTSREFLPNRLMAWRVVFRRSRGRRKGSGRFKDAEDFRQTIVCDLRHLLDNGLKATQEELAGLWYDRDNNPTAEADSLVAEIKRYCKTYKYRWEDLAEEAGRR
jgi:hypothetical protein